MIKNMFKMFFPSFFEEPEKPATVTPPKKRGRPKGSKNKVKKTKYPKTGRHA